MGRRDIRFNNFAEKILHMSDQSGECYWHFRIEGKGACWLERGSWRCKEDRVELPGGLYSPKSGQLPYEG